MKGQKFFLIIILCLFLSIFWNSTPITAAKDTYYPINGWRTSTLEKQGLNAEPLKNMENVIEESRIAVDSILIVRNGFLVYEKHFPYYDHANVHQMFSTTKSITSILIGIANNSGFITDLDQSIVEIFPGKSFTNMDDRKRNITIRHLLAMQCGLRWPEWSTHYLLSPVDPQDYEALANYTNPNLDGYSFNPANIVVQMANSSDWVQFVLDQPMVTDPGTSFNYNTGASHLLSVILQEKTNMSASQFAKEYLFGPLNITEYYWWADPQGYTLGGYGIWLAPEDMAKIGYLFLQKGVWNNRQVVAEKWVHDSTKTRQAFSGSSGYGYQWWTDPERDAFMTSGFGGQIIFVEPDQNLVVALTASEFHSNWPHKLLYDYILKAAESKLSKSTTKSTAGFEGYPIVFSLGLLIIFSKKRIRLDH